jgi:AraC-like DNA-binding protein
VPPLVRRTNVSSPHVSVEWMTRRGGGPVTWHYRQGRHAVFWFEHGIRSCTGAVNGSKVRQSLAGGTRLGFVAAGATVDAVFDVPADCSYLVASFDPAPMLLDDEECSRLGTPASQVGFADPGLTHAVGRLRQELVLTDAVSRLMVESWAIQAWALLHRRATTADGGGFSPAVLKKVLGRMRDGIADDVSMVVLADLVGLGPRQFCRRFRSSTGSTPGRVMDGMRLDLAAALLTTTRRSVTEIALDCGYSQPQHLATAFKRRYGTTPGGFRMATV